MIQNDLRFGIFVWVGENQSASTSDVTALPPQVLQVFDSKFPKCHDSDSTADTVSSERFLLQMIKISACVGQSLRRDRPLARIYVC